MHKGGADVLSAKKQDYLIDVANDTTYQNQSDEYKKSYAEWRANPHNSFGFQFIHDTREHSYIDGEGFVPHKAEVAERISMLKCCSLLGIVMIIMLVIDVANYMFVNKFAPDTTGTIIYFSQTKGTYSHYGLGMTVVMGCFYVAKFLMPALVFKLVTKIPNKVIFANSQGYEKMRGTALVIMMVMIVIGRIGQYAISHLFGLVHIDGIYSIMVYSDDPATMMTSFIFFAIVYPIVQEIFFRGVVLQTFRQFGDTFAIIITALVNALCFYDATYFLFVVCCTAVLGFFTIRTGSVMTAVYMSICSHIINYMLSYIHIYNMTYSVVIEVVVCAAIVAISLILYSRLTSFGDWSFNIEHDNSYMAMSKRIKSFIATNSVAAWIAAVLVAVFVCSRVI